MESRNLIGLILIVVIATLMFGLNSLVLEQMSDSDIVSEGSYAENVTNEGQDTINTMSQFLPILGIAGIAVVVIVMFLRGFGGAAGERGY